MANIIGVFIPQEYKKEDFAKETSFSKPTVKNESFSLVNRKIGYLFLEIAKLAAQDFLSANYKKFDALIKNFGCQITALEVYELSKDEALKIEAQKLLDFIMAFDLKVEKPDLTNPSLEDYLKDKVKMNYVISPSLQKLIRLRLLSLINESSVQTNEKGEKKEVLKTNIKNIVRILDLIPFEKSVQDTPKTKEKIEKVFQIIVMAMQSEESRQAVGYIRKKAKLLMIDTERKLLLESVLEEERIGKGKKKMQPISSVSLCYNTEVAIRSFAGIALIKNKIYLGSERIPEAKEIKIFMKFPEQEIIEAPTDKQEPLFVIEGFIKDEETFRSILKAKKVIEFIFAAGSILPQFAAEASKEPLKIVEAQNEIDSYKLMSELLDPFTLDHFYCSTLENLEA